MLFRLDLPEDSSKKIADFVKTRSLSEADRLTLAIIVGQAVCTIIDCWSEEDIKLLRLQLNNIHCRLLDSLRRDD